MYSLAVASSFRKKVQMSTKHTKWILLLLLIGEKNRQKRLVRKMGPKLLELLTKQQGVGHWARDTQWDTLCLNWVCQLCELWTMCIPEELWMWPNTFAEDSIISQCYKTNHFNHLQTSLNAEDKLLFNSMKSCPFANINILMAAKGNLVQNCICSCSQDHHDQGHRTSRLCKHEQFLFAVRRHLLNDYKVLFIWLYFFPSTHFQ